MLAAVGLAVSERADDSTAARKRAVLRVVREVAGYLGNTPTVARRSYIDPRVVDRYDDGQTVARVLTRLGEHHEFGELAHPTPMQRTPARWQARTSQTESPTNTACSG